MIRQMEPRSTGSRPSTAQAFTRVVQGWHTDQKGRLAMLRRNAGEPLAEARGITWMYVLLNDFGRGLDGQGRGYDDETLFLTATLLAFDRKYLEGRPKPPLMGSFGRTMAAMKRQPGANAESIERRFAILLDADFLPRTGEGELPFRLRQTVKLVLSKDVGIDWPRLLNDLSAWNNADKPVQKRWAKEFYAPYAELSEEQSVEEQSVEEENGEANAD